MSSQPLLQPILTPACPSKMRTKAINSLWTWAATTHCRGKSWAGIFTSFWADILWLVSLQKSLDPQWDLCRGSAEPSLQHFSAVAQVGNHINDLYYQLHIKLCKHQQLGKKNLLVRLKFVSMTFWANCKKIDFFFTKSRQRKGGLTGHIFIKKWFIWSSDAGVNRYLKYLDGYRGVCKKLQDLAHRCFCSELYSIQFSNSKASPHSKWKFKVAKQSVCSVELT